MKRILFKTNNSWAPTLIRVFLFMVLFAHGAQKLLGWFGGYGFNGTMGYFTDRGFPWIIGFLVIVIEFFGSISILLGLATRLWSFLSVILFIGIVATSHIQNGFFMNWFGNQKGEGFEYFLLAIAITTSLAITGGGKYSMDRIIE